MDHHSIGFLHPGAMGVSLAASAVASGHKAYWASEGRSDATRTRADMYGMTDTESIEALCANCSIIVSVCPPHAADQVADEVIGHGFEGTYVDANAISPHRSKEMGNRFAQSQITYVDGGIIGGPAWQPGTVLYLSGEYSESIASCFVDGVLETKIISKSIGDASALKMCYAAYSKGSMALLSAIVAVSEQLGIRDSLEAQWELDEPGFSQQTHERIIRVTKKAWRYAGEMEEIASTFESVDLPNGFHLGASEVYQRIADLKDMEIDPSISEVISRLSAEC